MKRELLDNGNIWQKADGRWIGLVRYKDEFGVAQRKSFSSKKKKTLQAKMTEYVKNFNEQVASSDESRKPLKESMKNWLRVYKYPEVERTTDKAHERRLRLHHEQESLLTAQNVLQAALPLRITTLIKLFFRRLKRMRLQNMPASFLLNTILKIFSEHRIS